MPRGTARTNYSGKTQKGTVASSSITSEVRIWLHTRLREMYQKIQQQYTGQAGTTPLCWKRLQLYRLHKLMRGRWQIGRKCQWLHIDYCTTTTTLCSATFPNSPNFTAATVSLMKVILKLKDMKNAEYQLLILTLSFCLSEVELWISIRRKCALSCVSGKAMVSSIAMALLYDINVIIGEAVGSGINGHYLD